VAGAQAAAAAGPELARRGLGRIVALRNHPLTSRKIHEAIRRLAF
jgi:hypothetical protein